MSVNTRLSGTRGAARRPLAFGALTFTPILAAMLAVSPVPAFAFDAPPLPPQVVEVAPNLKVQGGGELTFFGISVYDGYYWSPNPGWSQDRDLCFGPALPPRAQWREDRGAQRQ